MAEKLKSLENVLARTDKDISELLTKVNDTINDYETKLEKKEEQMWQMTVQISEGKGCVVPALFLFGCVCFFAYILHVSRYQKDA